MNRRAFCQSSHARRRRCRLYGFRETRPGRTSRQSGQRPVRRHDDVRRAGRSLVPRRHAGSAAMHHMTHMPFLMARKGSRDRDGVRHEAGAGCGAGGVRHRADRHRIRRSSCIATSTTPRSTSSRDRATRSTTAPTKWRIDEPHRARQAGPRQPREVGVVHGLAAWRTDRKLGGPSGRAQGVVVRRPTSSG